jgi:hypothetical protein
MNRYSIIKEIRRLPIQKRILVIEKGIIPKRREEEITEITRAADVLYRDYKTDKELTAFTNIN